jgi:hypothetical protein
MRGETVANTVVRLVLFCASLLVTALALAVGAGMPLLEVLELMAVRGGAIALAIGLPLGGSLLLTLFVLWVGSYFDRRPP